MTKSTIRTVLKNTFYPLIVLLTVFFIFTIKNPFYLNSTPPTTITSKHDWQDFSVYKDKKIFTGQKLKAEFKASDNRLGIIEVEFDISAKWLFPASDFDSLIFRIKEKDKRSWYYEKTLSNIRHPNIFYAFGFPVVENSKNKTYQFEIESVAGADNNAFSLSSKDSFFLSKYSYPLNYLKQNKREIAPFIFGKISSFFASLASISLVNYLFILFFSFSLAIIQVLIKSKKSDPIISSSQRIFLNFLNLTWLLTVGITILMIFVLHSEAIEWVIYQVSAVSIFIVSFILSLLTKKLSPAIYKKLLNFHFISFASFILILSLTKNIMPRHLLFLLLSLLPFIQKISWKNIKTLTGVKISFIKHHYPIQLLLINLISLISVLSYFNIKFPDFSFSKILIIILITIILYFILQSPLKIIKTSFKIPAWILLIISLSTIFYITQKSVDYHHYSFYIGPVLDVIKGKSLLGETPSQYGYLSIYFLAFFLKRIGVSLANFNLVNILLFTFYYLFAGLIFFKLIKNKFLAIITSVIFITLQAIFSYHSNSFPPSIGPMRFGIGLLIIFLLSYFPQNISFFLGSIFASIAIFWSIETAVYIVPAWLVVCLIFSYNSTNSFKEFFKSSIRKLSFFGITTAIFFSLIILKKYSIQHVFLKISSYFEFAKAYKNGAGSILIPVYGNYYLLIIPMVLGITTFASLLIKNIKTKYLPLLAFISIHNIAIFSYFVSRSHENNIVNITCFAILELIIIFKILTTALKINITHLKRTISLPIFLFLVMFSFRLHDRLINSYQYTQDSYKQNMTDWFNPKPVKPILITALEKYNFRNNPIVLLSLENDTRLLVESNLKNELPLNPAIMTLILQDTGYDKYINPRLKKLTIGTVVIADVNISKSFLGPVFSNIQSIYQLESIGTIDSENLGIYQITAKF